MEHMVLSLLTANEKMAAGRYLVSESHDRSIERRPESLLVGSPVGADHSEPQQ